VQATLENWRSAPINAPLKATLGFLEKLTLTPESVSATDIRPLRAQGLSDSAIEDAIHVCTLFNIYDRLADSLEFDIPDARGFDISAKMLLKRGYAF
jgi:alkylhydroperoxidase family enzyme